MSALDAFLKVLGILFVAVGVMAMAVLGAILVVMALEFWPVLLAIGLFLVIGYGLTRMTGLRVTTVSGAM
ncbi:MAG TPA: hypothetical protein PLF22_13130 [Pseudomonadales bacterium]|nr:hypothetical protein [Pseudomonadales bacterium]